MTAAAQRLSALNKLKDQRLSSDLLKDFSLEQLTNAFDRLDLTHFPFELGPGTTDLQKALLEHEGFLSTLRRLLDAGLQQANVILLGEPMRREHVSENASDHTLVWAYFLQYYLRYLKLEHMHIATPQELEAHAAQFDTMPTWPAPGSVRPAGNSILIKIGPR